MRPGFRHAAFLAAFSLMVAACTGSDDVSSTPTSPPDATPTTAGPSAASIIAALGGIQAVQDFAIFAAMWDESGDQPEAFYSDVLEVASGL